MLNGIKGLEYYQNYITPINYYEVDSALYEVDKNDCYRMILIEDGKGSILINNKKISIRPMTLLCLNEKDIVVNIDFIGIKIHILCFLPAAINNRFTVENMTSNEGLSISDSQDKQFLLPFILHNETYLEFKYINIETGTRLLGILQSLKEQLFVQNASWPCLSRSYFLELLFLIERTYWINQVNNTTNNNKFSSDDILLYLHNNYRKKITIGDLAKRFKTNRTTLSKEFKKTTGQTIISYILKIRVQIAASMLRDTTLNVYVIIERVGINNITHFNKVFKEYYQCLPKEYRKNYKPY